MSKQKTENMFVNAFNTSSLDNFLSKEPDTVALDLTWTQEKGLNIGEIFQDPNNIKGELSENFYHDDKYVDGKSLLNEIVASESNIDSKIKSNIKRMASNGLHKGLNKKEIISSVNTIIPQSKRNKFASLVEDSVKEYGSVGRFIIDASAFKSCEEAFASSAGNPWRSKIAYIKGCTCGKHIKTASGKYDLCPKTGLKVIAGASDIDPEWAGDTFIDLMNASSIPQDTQIDGDTEYEQLVDLCRKMDGYPDKNDISQEGAGIGTSLIEEETTPIEIQSQDEGLFDGDGTDFDIVYDEKPSIIEVDLDSMKDLDPIYGNGDVGENISYDEVSPDSSIQDIGFEVLNPYGNVVEDSYSPTIMQVEYGNTHSALLDSVFKSSNGVDIEIEKKTDTPICEFAIRKTASCRKL